MTGGFSEVMSGGGRGVFGWEVVGLEEDQKMRRKIKNKDQKRVG